MTNDEALVKNLDLNYKVVYAGSEAALIQAFRAGREEQEAGARVLLRPAVVHVGGRAGQDDLPPYKPRCDADPAKVACDYPLYKLDKIVATKFADSGSPAYDLVKNFQWTNDDQNLVAKYIAEDKMDAEEAAKKWVDDNQDKVDAWLK